MLHSLASNLCACTWITRAANKPDILAIAVGDVSLDPQETNKIALKHAEWVRMRNQQHHVWEVAE